MKLTKTEFRIVTLLSTGKEAKEIALSFYKETSTIRTHIRNIKRKNNVRNIPELVKNYVLEFGDPSSNINQ